MRGYMLFEHKTSLFKFQAGLIHSPVVLGFLCGSHLLMKLVHRFGNLGGAASVLCQEATLFVAIRQRFLMIEFEA